MEEKNLIIVYNKEYEIAFNYLKKLIESKDDLDDGTVIGTEDESVKVIGWDEKTWLDNKKAGNLDDKILFIGDISGIDNLIPILDIKFKEYGVSYGVAGKQAVVFVNEKELKKEDDYDKFYHDLQIVCKNDITQEYNGSFKSSLSGLGKAWYYVMHVHPAVTVQDIVLSKKEAKAVRIQQLFYGITKLYYNDLNSFMIS